MAQTLPVDFSFNYSFGYGLKKTYDHRDNFDDSKNLLTVYAVDTVLKINLKLSPEEKQQIFNKIEEIDFLNYPAKYYFHHSDTVEAFLSTPCQHFTLLVIMNTTVKTTEWNNCLKAPTRDTRHESLMQLDRLIQKIIWSYNPLKDFDPDVLMIDPE